MSLSQTVKDIKSLKIQGAENVAKEAAKALYELATALEGKKGIDPVEDFLGAKQMLSMTRPTEPCMRNTLNYILQDVPSAKDTTVILPRIKQRCSQALSFYHDSAEKITEFGAKKIKDGQVIFTHCHSSTVTGIIKKAWKDGKSISVHNTETRPLFQGRITAMELSREGIPVQHYVDSAARIALKKADLMLIGADAITSEGKVINKIGSELFAETAKRFDVPVYVCTNSWKFDPLTVYGLDEPIEIRDPTEIWDAKKKGIRILNYAFESVSPELITGIITEKGIYKPEAIAQMVKENYPWMFQETSFSRDFISS